MKQRTRLPRISILILAVSMAAALGSISATRVSAKDVHEVTHGPIIGDVSESGAVAMVRVNAPVAVRLLISTDRLFRSNVQLSPAVLADNSSDLTVHIPLTGLQPATTYHYKVLLGGRPVDILSNAKFRTAPMPDATVDFDFAVFSDLSMRNRPAESYRSASENNPAFALMIGDFDHRNPGVFPAPITIWNWRVMHRQVLEDWAEGKDFARYIARLMPVYAIWDDHDYGADNTDRTAPWKALAVQAFREYHPLPSQPNPDGGLWYSFRYAQAEFFVLDLRSQRDPNDTAPGPDKSMLNGGRISNGQKDWLMDELMNSTARWKFIISSSVWNPNSKQVDSWYLYQHEQQELVTFIEQTGISGVIVLSGDLHSAGGIDDGTNSYFPELSVPTINMQQQRNCTGGYCGQWSQGILTGIDPSGYGLVRVRFEPATGKHWVALEARGKDGSLRLSLSVELP